VDVVRSAGARLHRARYEDEAHRISSSGLMEGYDIIRAALVGIDGTNAFNIGDSTRV
jgi:hypothetical protein